MNNYCTLFDSGYLVRFLTMYRSLVSVGADFYLFLFPMDRKCEDILEKLNLDNTIIIKIGDFETSTLKEKKKERTWREYCWTCTALTIEYVFNNYNVDELTYIDSDLFFFQNPSVLIEEFHRSHKDVMLISHRFPPREEEKALYGKYNVQFMIFKNSQKGRKALKWWVESCLEWCMSIPMDGKYADQKYLDYFEEKFSCTYELTNIGGGVAPWNIHQYDVSEVDGMPMVDSIPVVFYHFHNLKVFRGFYNPGIIHGEFSDVEKGIIYDPYIKAWGESIVQLEKFAPEFVRFYDSIVGGDKMIDNFLGGMTYSHRTTVKLQLFLEQFFMGHNKIAIWGYGTNGRRLHQFLKSNSCSVGLIVDRNYKDIVEPEIVALSPDVLFEKKYYVCISPQQSHDEIEFMLEKNGYKKYEDYIYIGDFFEELYNYLVAEG